MTKNISFKNWTLTDFKCKFSNQEYIFEPGKVYSVPADIAPHFAHHLAVRELNSSHDEKDHALPEGKMKEYMDKCFPNSSIVEVESLRPAMTFEIVNEPLEEKLAPQENKTETNVQNEPVPVDEDVRDNKVPKKVGRPKKVLSTTDQEYVK